jgi:putative ABC transport system permease protein
VAAVSALLALVGSGLLGVLVAVLALGVRSVQQRRAPVLALAQARGAGPLRMRSVMILEGLLVAVPAGAVAIGLAAVLLPLDPGPAGWLLPIAATATVPVLFAVLTPTRLAGRDREDLTVGARSSTRWILEAVVIGLAAVSLFLLARRGLVGTSAVVGVDPLLAAMPVLLAAAVCVVVLRIYPAPMLAVQAAARRSRSATGLVGAARAVRAPALGFAAVLALVVGVAVVVASITLATTVRAALERTAVEAVGADLRVEAANLPDEVLDTIRAADGVTAAAGVAIVDGVQFRDEAGNDELFAVVADTEALHEVRDDLPVLTAATGAVQIAAADDWAEDIVGTELQLAGAPASLAAVLPVDAIPGVTRTWALVDSSALEQLDIDPPVVRQVLVRLSSDADAEAVGAVLDELVREAQQTDTAGSAVVVTSAEGELAAATAAPTVGGLERFLLLAAAAALLLTVLAVLLTSITGAKARGRLVAVLRVLGLNRRQVRRLLTWELAPVTITAAIVGTGLGLVLPLIIATALDLRPFVGGRVQPGLVVDPLWVLAGVGAFLLTVLLAGAVAAAIGRRIVPAGALKMGDA